MDVILTRSFRIESARSLPRLPPTHPCARVHGHSFLIELELAGPIDPELGWLIDYNDIAAAFEPLRLALDHRLLNEVEGLENPTSELIARWIFDRLSPSLNALTAVTIMETPETRAIYRPCPSRGAP
jgi:6-pyruvoyltetrahydropterin/6-carboxytetrahydropterin synthase